MGGKRLPPPPAASPDPVCTMETLLFQLLYCLEWGGTVQGCGRLVEKGQRAGSQPGGSSHAGEVCPLQPLLPLRTPAEEVAMHISLGTPPAPNLQLQNTGAFCGGPSWSGAVSEHPSLGFVLFWGKQTQRLTCETQRQAFPPSIPPAQSSESMWRIRCAPSQFGDGGSSMQSRRPHLHSASNHVAWILRPWFSKCTRHVSCTSLLRSLGVWSCPDNLISGPEPRRSLSEPSGCTGYFLLLPWMLDPWCLDDGATPVRVSREKSRGSWKGESPDRCEQVDRTWGADGCWVPLRLLSTVERILLQGSFPSVAWPACGDHGERGRAAVRASCLHFLDRSYQCLQHWERRESLPGWCLPVQQAAMEPQLRTRRGAAWCGPTSSGALTLRMRAPTSTGTRISKAVSIPSLFCLKQCKAAHV